MNENIKYLPYVLGLSIASAFIQVVLKKYLIEKGGGLDGGMHEYFTYYFDKKFLFIILTYICIFFVTIYTLSKVEVSYFAFTNSLYYISIIVFSYLFLGTTIDIKELIGCVFIIIGVIIIS